MATRYAFSKIGKFASTPSGGRIVPGTFSRTGVQVYETQSGKKIREYRSPEEVFSAEAIASFRTAPVTIGHPPSVHPGNFQQMTHGLVLDASERNVEDGKEWVAGSVALMTSRAIQDADSGKLSEISVGYDCDFDETPGVSPQGEPYDRSQIRIRANHIALLPPNEGRAGRQARLRLDGNQELIHEENPQMDPEKLALKVAELEAKLALEKTRADAADAKVTELTKAEATATARADSATKEVEDLKAVVAGESKRFDARVALIGRTSDVLGAEYVFEGKDAHTIRLDSLKAIDAKLPEGREKDPVYVEAYFDSRVVAKADQKHDYNLPTKETGRADSKPFDFAAGRAAKVEAFRKETK